MNKSFFGYSESEDQVQKQKASKRHSKIPSPLSDIMEAENHIEDGKIEIDEYIQENSPPQLQRNVFFFDGPMRTEATGADDFKLTSNVGKLIRYKQELMNGAIPKDLEKWNIDPESLLCYVSHAISSEAYERDRQKRLESLKKRQRENNQTEDGWQLVFNVPYHFCKVHKVKTEEDYIMMQTCSLQNSSEITKYSEITKVSTI